MVQCSRISGHNIWLRNTDDTSAHDPRLLPYYLNLGLVPRKPVFGVSDKARLKLVTSGTETGKKIEISIVASFDMILSKMPITKALISLHGWQAGHCPLLFTNPEDRFSSVEAHLMTRSQGYKTFRVQLN